MSALSFSCSWQMTALLILPCFIERNLSHLAILWGVFGWKLDNSHKFNYCWKQKNESGNHCGLLHVVGSHIPPSYLCITRCDTQLSALLTQDAIINLYTLLVKLNFFLIYWIKRNINRSSNTVVPQNGLSYTHYFADHCCVSQVGKVMLQLQNTFKSRWLNSAVLLLAQSQL